MADEPDLHVGDSGEWVTHLQQRLQVLSLYSGPIDGEYTEETDAAVALLHESAGMAHESAVSAESWRALSEQEEQAGVATYTEDAEPELAETPVGQRSEDGQWEWDGAEWKAVADEQADEQTTEQATEAAGQAADGQLSEDGKWRWDGTEWQPVTPDQEAGAAEQREVAIDDDADDPVTDEAELIA